MFKGYQGLIANGCLQMWVKNLTNLFTLKNIFRMLGILLVKY